MTAGELLRMRAASLQHAIVQDFIYTDERKLEQIREHHYLSCRRCAIEKEADEMDRVTSSIPTPPSVEPTHP